MGGGEEAGGGPGSPSTPSKLLRLDHVAPHSSEDSLTAAREHAYELTNAMEAYTPDLANLLLPFCRDPFKDDQEQGLSSKSVVSKGCFLDLGRVAAGASCVVKVKYTNVSQDDLMLDLTARDFGAETQVKSFTLALVPGFNKTASVSFTATSKSQSAVGWVDVKWQGADRSRPGIVGGVSIPVFYFVGPHPLDDKNRDHGSLTLATLPSTLRTRLNLRDPVSLRCFGQKQRGSARLGDGGLGFGFSSSLLSSSLSVGGDASSVADPFPFSSSINSLSDSVASFGLPFGGLGLDDEFLS